MGILQKLISLQFTVHSHPNLTWSPPLLAMMAGKCFKKKSTLLQKYPIHFKEGPKGPQSPEANESPKATCPLQELEVGSHRLLYLLVLFT